MIEFGVDLGHPISGKIIVADFIGDHFADIIDVLVERAVGNMVRQRFKFFVGSG